jgi:hypothetical protein
MRRPKPTQRRGKMNQVSKHGLENHRQPRDACPVILA